jgi:hypothetical protein
LIARLENVTVTHQRTKCCSAADAAMSNRRCMAATV